MNFRESRLPALSVDPRVVDQLDRNGMPAQLVIEIQTERAPRVCLWARSYEDEMRLRLWLEGCPDLLALIELAYAISTERQAA